MPACSSQLQAHWFLNQEIILIYNMQNKCYMFTTYEHNFTQFLSVLGDDDTTHDWRDSLL